MARRRAPRRHGDLRDPRRRSALVSPDGVARPRRTRIAWQVTTPNTYSSRGSTEYPVVRPAISNTPSVSAGRQMRTRSVVISRRCYAARTSKTRRPSALRVIACRSHHTSSSAARRWRSPSTKMPSARRSCQGSRSLMGASCRRRSRSAMTSCTSPTSFLSGGCWHRRRSAALRSCSPCKWPLPTCVRTGRRRRSRDPPATRGHVLGRSPWPARGPLRASLERQPAPARRPARRAGRRRRRAFPRPVPAGGDRFGVSYRTLGA